jgi:hypothetical protein
MHTTSPGALLCCHLFRKVKTANGKQEHTEHSSFSQSPSTRVDTCPRSTT